MIPYYYYRCPVDVMAPSADAPLLHRGIGMAIGATVWAGIGLSLTFCG